MNKKIFIILLFLFFNLDSIAKSKISYFELGKKNFNEKKFEQAELNFQKEIVRNTKSAKSYLYLAKIYKIKKLNDELEKNLNTVLLLDPKNEEALYMLIVKKVNDGDYDLAKNKLNIFKNSCKDLCGKNDQLNKLIKKSKI